MELTHFNRQTIIYNSQLSLHFIKFQKYLLYLYYYLYYYIIYIII